MTHTTFLFVSAGAELSTDFFIHTKLSCFSLIQENTTKWTPCRRLEQTDEKILLKLWVKLSPFETKNCNIELLQTIRAVRFVLCTEEQKKMLEKAARCWAPWYLCLLPSLSQSTCPTGQQFVAVPPPPETSVSRAFVSTAVSLRIMEGNGRRRGSFLLALRAQVASAWNLT